MRARIILYPEVGSVLGRMVQTNEALELQRLALRAKVDQRQTVAEDVMNPSNLCRLGNDIETAIQQTLIEAVARAEHELMQARSYGSFVAIRRLMMDGVHGHSGMPNPRIDFKAQGGQMSVPANRANLPDLERHLKLALVKFRGSGVSG
jgi:hypothetical protein